MAEGLDEERNDAEIVNDDRRADIEAAFDRLSAEEPAAPEAPAAPEPVKVDGRTTRERDEHGRYRPKVEASEPEVPKGRSRQSAQAELEAPEAKGKVGKPEAAVKTDPVDNVPSSFKPGLLEDWKAVPRSVREEIHRREAEQYAYLEQTKVQRAQLQQIQQAVQPYQALLQAEGGSVPTALRNYLQAATLMRQGSPLAKAQWIAKLTKEFTAHEHLGLLDQAMAAEFGINGAQAPTTEPNGYRPPQQEFRDPRVDEMLAQQQQAQQQEWQQGYQEAQSERDSWVAEKSPEFLPWVKNRMATLLETAARDGEELGYDEAYDAACRTHPEVRKILLQREESARAQPSAVQRSRRASVSLRPQGAVAPSGGNEGSSRRSDIEDAWEAVMGR
jgi:hypothetical protein